jgi:type I restriction enzyme, S subunit
MFSKLPSHAEVKQDGFWAAHVPAHWAVSPGLAVVSENRRKNSDLSEAQVLSLSFGRVVVKPVEKQRGLVPDSYEGYQVLNPGDIVVRPTDLQNDQTSIRVGLVRDRGIITSAYIGLRTKAPWTTGYAHAYLSTVDSTKRVYGMGSGLRQQLGWTDIKRMPCLVPPANEQADIVKYLAHANARIDKAIAAKRELLMLLSQSRRATIDELVCGTSRSDAEPSSAPWLATVPLGWEWRRCRMLTTLVTSGSRGWAEYYADTGAMFLQSGNLGRELCLRLDNVQRVDLPGSLEGLRTRVQPHDILVCITGALTGNVASVPGDWSEEAYVNQHVALVRSRPSAVNPQFLAYALSSTVSQLQFKGSEYGGTKQGLGLDEVKNVEVLLPPVPEQAAIVSQIRLRTARLDQLATRARREIELLNEFRTRLAADVVTGQVDVRAVAATMPEIDLTGNSVDSGIADDYPADFDDAIE